MPLRQQAVQLGAWQDSIKILIRLRGGTFEFFQNFACFRSELVLRKLFEKSLSSAIASALRFS